MRGGKRELWNKRRGNEVRNERRRKGGRLEREGMKGAMQYRQQDRGDRGRKKGEQEEEEKGNGAS